MFIINIFEILVRCNFGDKVTKSSKKLTIKWKNDTIIISIDEIAPITILIEELKNKIETSPSFFKDSILNIVFEGAKLDSEQKRLMLNFIKEKTGASVNLKSQFNFNESPDKNNDSTPFDANDNPNDNIAEFEKAKVYKSTIRSGQIVDSDNDLVIVGDVNQGAEVCANGSIYAFGKIRGKVHAGQSGNNKVVVMAYKLEPIQITIAGIIAKSPNKSGTPRVLEIAYIKNDRIIIRPYI